MAAPGDYTWVHCSCSCGGSTGQAPTLTDSVDCWERVYFPGLLSTALGDFSVTVHPCLGGSMHPGHGEKCVPCLGATVCPLWGTMYPFKEPCIPPGPCVLTQGEGTLCPAQKQLCILPWWGCRDSDQSLGRTTHSARGHPLGILFGMRGTVNPSRRGNSLLPWLSTARLARGSGGAGRPEAAQQ